MDLFRPEYDMKAMGQKMKYYRTKRNLTVEEVRQYMQVSSVQAIYKWESGMCFPTADNLMALAELYHVSPMDLMPKRRQDKKRNAFKSMRNLIERHGRNNKVDYMIYA